VKYFSFVYLDDFDIDELNDLEARFERQETVVLASELELTILLQLLGSKIGSGSLPEISDVLKSYILEESLTSINEQDFDTFYSDWLRLTNRENNMDEYGQLLHLNSFLQAHKDKQKMVVLSEAI
jgi:hypothetical protein